MVTTSDEGQVGTEADDAAARKRDVADARDGATKAGIVPPTEPADDSLATGNRQPTTRLDVPTLRVRVVRIVLRGLCRLLFRVRVEGLERLPRRQMIVCANHMSWIDAFLVLLFLPAELRLFVLGRRTAVMTTPWRTRMINWLGIMIPLDLDRPEVAMRQMGRVLEQGGSLVIFPEGGWGYVEGALKPLRTGAARLSLQSGLPIVPVAILGTKRLQLRRRLTLRIGVPIDPPLSARDDCAGARDDRPGARDDRPGPTDDRIAVSDGSAAAVRNDPRLGDGSDRDGGDDGSDRDGGNDGSSLRDRGHALTDTLRQALLALLSGAAV